MESMAGPIAECLKDYFAKRGPQTIAVYAAVKPSVAAEWLKTPPRGLANIEIAYFLESEGYGVSELKALPCEVYNFGKLFYRRLVTIEMVLHRYGDIITSRDALTDLFRRPDKRGPKTLAKLSRIYNEWKVAYPELEDKNAPTPAPKPEVAVFRRKSETKPLPIPVQNGSIPVKKKVLMRLFASLVDTGLPLGEQILSDDFSQEDRYALRVSLLSGGRLAKFADIVNALTSERARENKQTEGIK